MTVQYTIPFKVQPDYGLASLVPHAGLVKAQAALANPQDWLVPVLILSGAAASGKSHLAAQVAAEVRLWDLTTHPLHTRERADALFHTLNTLQVNGGRLLILSRRHPNRIYPDLPDLDSRLRSALHMEIEEPRAHEVRQAILFKICADHQLTLDLETATYVLTRLPQSLAALRLFCERALQSHFKARLSKVAAKPLIQAVQSAMGEAGSDRTVTEPQRLGLKDGQLSLS